MEEFFAHRKLTPNERDMMIVIAAMIKSAGGRIEIAPEEIASLDKSEKVFVDTSHDARDGRFIFTVRERQ